MTNKILTIVIPTYNMEKYISKCLTSLIIKDEELLERIEVLVVIDGSKDKSSEIAHKYSELYPQTFRVIDKDNGNYGSCVNKGLAEAQGKYIKVLDADDYFDTNEFLLYVKDLADLDVDLVLTPFFRVNEDGKMLREKRYSFPVGVALDATMLNEADNIEMHAFTYRVEMLRSFGYQQTEGISYTDTEWVMIPLPYIKTFAYLKYNVYRYLVGREGQTVDETVILRNYKQLTTALRHIIISYTNHQKLGKAEVLIKRKFLLCVNFLYRIVLVDGKGKNLSDLISFDKEMKMLGLFYKETDQMGFDKRLPYQYLHMWRKSYNYSDISKLQICLYRILRYYRKKKDIIKSLCA